MRFLAFVIAALGAAQAPAPPSAVVAVFEGTLRCADCASLRQELSLSAAATDSPVAGTFSMKYTYVGSPKGDVTREEHGLWKFVKGTPADKYAAVYELTVDKPKRQMYWLVASTTEVRALDAKRRDAAPPVSLTLKPMSLSRAAPPPGVYRPIATDDIGIEMVAVSAIGEQQLKTPGISLVKITSAERQIADGTNYRLCLSMQRNGRVEPARMTLYQDQNGRMQMSSWAWGACGRE